MVNPSYSYNTEAIVANAQRKIILFILYVKKKMLIYMLQDSIISAKSLTLISTHLTWLRRSQPHGRECRLPVSSSKVE
jgi:hypothetical protein